MKFLVRSLFLLAAWGVNAETALAGHGIEINGDKITMYFDDEGWRGNWNYMCLGSDCRAGSLVGDRWQRDLTNFGVRAGQVYTIQLKVDDFPGGVVYTPEYTVEATEVTYDDVLPPSVSPFDSPAEFSDPYYGPVVETRRQEVDPEFPAPESPAFDDRVVHFVDECVRIGLENGFEDISQCTTWAEQIFADEDPEAYLALLESQFRTYGYRDFGEPSAIISTPAPTPLPTPESFSGVVRVEAETGRVRGAADVYSDSFASGGHGVAYIYQYGADLTIESPIDANKICVGYASESQGDFAMDIGGQPAPSSPVSFSTTGGWVRFYTEACVSDIVYKDEPVKIYFGGVDPAALNVDYIEFHAGAVPTRTPAPIPISTPSPVPTPVPVAEPILIEGEHFEATGGTQDGFTIRTFWGTTTFADHVLTGGWAEYEVYVPVGGVYDLTFMASTQELSDSNAKITIDGDLVAEALVYGDDLNTFVEHEIAKGLTLSEGTHQVRIEATGSVLKWHFFLDSFTFTPSDG